jgi:predicted HAD superfamily phosphohydrolase YqeG
MGMRNIMRLKILLAAQKSTKSLGGIASNQEKRNLFVWKEILGVVWFFSAKYPFVRKTQRLLRSTPVFEQNRELIILVGFQGERLSII